MRDELAERLLGAVMEWAAADLAKERQRLVDMAAYKYNEYQQFYPGQRFLESLALWLSQFDPEERKIAYRFVTERLVFLSNSELNHLVSMAYPDLIRPWLFRTAAEQIRTEMWNVGRIASSREFRLLRRRAVFLGMSDGARIDIFRRANKRELDHEQIVATYDVSPEKANDMLGKLTKALTSILEREPTEAEARFQTVLLLDDFSASGTSIISGGACRFSGKVAKVYESLRKGDSGLARLVALEGLRVWIVLYVATQQAITNIKEHAGHLLGEIDKNWSLLVVQKLDDRVPLSDYHPEDPAFLRLVDQDRYYDSSVEDENTRKGGTDVKRGFAGCSLPLVLSHNTPNNSIFLLWADPGRHSERNLRGLFPRVSRHGGNS